MHVIFPENHDHAQLSSTPMTFSSRYLPIKAEEDHAQDEDSSSVERTWRRRFWVLAVLSTSSLLALLAVLLWIVTRPCRVYNGDVNIPYCKSSYTEC